jgi:hypothetical protein
MNGVFTSSTTAKSEKCLLFAKGIPANMINHINMLMPAKFFKIVIFIE